MLKISTEYHKGVFFVRIVGRNDNGRKLKEIFNMIDELGIRNIVLNLNKLDFLSVDQIEEISNFKENKLKKRYSLSMIKERVGCLTILLFI